MDKDQSPSRRTVLQRLAAVPLAIGAFAALQAKAEAKAPQLTVAYRNKPHGTKSCDECRSFIRNRAHPKANGQCKKVAGSISPNGYCVLFHAGDNAKNT